MADTTTTGASADPGSSAQASVSVVTQQTGPSTVNLPPTTDWMRNLVGGFVLSSFLFILLLMCWHPVPTENHDLVVLLIGIVTGNVSAIVTFYFGSTSSSRDKDKAISALSGAPAAPKPEGKSS